MGAPFQTSAPLTISEAGARPSDVLSAVSGGAGTSSGRPGGYLPPGGLPGDSDVPEYGTPSGSGSSGGGKIGQTLAEIHAMRQHSAFLYGQAKTAFQNAYSFTIPELDPIVFAFTPETFNEVRLGPTVAFPTGLLSDPTFSGEIGEAPRMELDPFVASTFSPPSASEYDFDTAPPRLPGTGRAPAPAAFDLEVPQMPDLSFELLPVLDAGAPPAPPAELDLAVPLADVEPIDLDEVPLPDETSLQKLESMIARKFQRNPYFEKTMPVALAASGSLLAGGFVIDTAKLAEGFNRNIDEALARHDRITGTLWSRRGLNGNASAGGYNARLAERTKADAANDWDVAVNRMRMQILPVVLQVTTEAHAFAVEMAGELCDLDFALLSAEYEAMRNLFALAVARYNLQLVRVRARAAEYRAEVAQAIAYADRYRLRAQQASITGRVNTALAAGYTAEQRAKGVQADAFTANIDASAALVQAYDVQMRALEVDAQTRRAELMSYQARLAEWEAGLDEARREYQKNNAENRAIAAQNRARAAQMDVGVAQQEAVAEQARASAMEAVSLSAQLVAETANRGARFSDLEFSNLQESAVYQAALTQYRADAAKATSQLAPENEINRTSTQINASVAATSQRVSQNAIRAAELTQQYRMQLMESLRGLYDSIGQADAARVAGELSQFRASLGLRATGDISFTTQLGDDYQFTTSLTNAQSNTSRTEWVAAES